MRAVDTLWGDTDDPPQGRARSISAFDDLWGADRDDEAERRRQERIAVQAADRRRRALEDRSQRGGPPLAAPRRPEKGTATVTVGPPMPAQVRDRDIPRKLGGRTFRAGLEGLTPVASAVPYDEGEEPNRFDRVMRTVGRVGSQAAMLPLRTADVAGRGVGAAGDFGIEMAREYPIETVMLSNPWTAPAAMVALGIQGAGRAGLKTRARFEGRPLADEEEAARTEGRLPNVPSMAEIGMEAVPIAFAGLGARPFARQLNRGGSVVDRILAKQSKVAAQDFAMNKRFVSAVDRQAREKVALPLVEREKDAAEIASAQRASRQREPKLLTSGSIITPPPGSSDPADAITRVLRQFQKGRGEASPIAPWERDLARTKAEAEAAGEARRGQPPRTSPIDLPAASDEASAASASEIEVYRRMRDEGTFIPRRELGTPRQGEPLETFEQRVNTRARTLETGPASESAAADVGDFFESRAAGRTLARDEAGRLRSDRNLDDLELTELEEEANRMRSNLAEKEAAVAHRQDPRWANYQDLPDTERLGTKRITDAERAAGARGARKKMEDLPTGDDMYDADELAALRAQDAAYRSGTMGRQATEKGLARVEAAIARKKRTGAASSELIAPVGGAVAGGVTGGMVGDTPEERRRNMILGAAGGAGLGAITSRVLGRAPSIAARGGVSRGGERGGYVGEPTYMVGTRAFPKPIAPEELARMSATERTMAERGARPADMGPALDRSTKSPVLRAEEEAAVTGLDSQLAKLKARVAAGEEPLVDARAPSSDIDLADVSAEDWWDALPMEKRKEIFPEFSKGIFGKGAGILKADSWWFSDPESMTLPSMKQRARDAHAKWIEEVRALPDAGILLGNRIGAVAPELLAASGGAVAGGATIDESDTTGEKIAKVVGGGLAGALGVKAIKRLGKGAAGAAVEADVPLVSGLRPRRKVAELFNKSVQAGDPTGRVMWPEEEKELIKRGVKKTPVTDAQVAAWARDVDVDRLTLSDVKRMNVEEMGALGERIKFVRSRMDELDTQVEKNAGKMSAEEIVANRDEHKHLFGRILNYDHLLNSAGSETGRALRYLGRIAARRGTPEAAFTATRRALGLSPEMPLGDDITKRLAGVMNNPKLSLKERQQMIAQIVGEYIDKGPIAATLDIRRWGMLTAPATHAVNLTGNVVEAASNLVITPIAAAIDRMVSAAKGAERSISLTGRAKGYTEGLTGAIRKIDRKHFEGINPEDPLNTLNMQRANYVKSFGLDKEGAWRAALRPAVRILQRSGDIVYGVMGATDAPFYQATLKSSLMERAGLRASREGMKAGTPEFKARVGDLMKLENVSEVDATMAVIEALDATFKSPTGISAAMKMLEEVSPVMGTTARWVVPFPNTPTNLVRKGLEATPGIGQVLTEIQARTLKKQLQALGATKEEIAREVQRKRITGAAKQLTTGAGLVGLGYYWTKNGMLSGEYIKPMARDEAERDEAGLRRITGQGPLTLKIGDTAHSLSGFAQFAPLLALGHALAQEDEAAADDPRNQVPLMERVGRVATSTAMSTVRTFANFPLLQGVESLSRLTEGVGRYVGREVASLIPFSSGIAATGRVMDREAKRPPETAAEAVKERLPRLREDIPSAVTPLGKVQERPGAVAATISPTRPQKLITGPVEAEFVKLKVFPGMPKRLGGESRATYSERVKLEGGELNDVLTRVIASPDYTQWPPPEWVVRATENNAIWSDESDKRSSQTKAKVALLEYMTRYVRAEQTKRRKAGAP